MPSTTRRLSLPAPTGGESADGPDGIGDLATVLDDIILGYGQGLLAGRPDAGTEGRMYYATDDGILYYDFGGGWIPAGQQPGDLAWSARPETTRLGYLLLTGTQVSPQLVSRATYAALFAVVGTTWGAGDGRTTFALPQLADRVAVGTGRARPLGTLAGAATHSHAGNIPGHVHAIGADGAHAHGISADGSHGHLISGSNLGTRQYPNGSGQQGAYLQNTSPATAPIDAAGTHSHGGVTGAAGVHSHGGATGGPSAVAFLTGTASTEQPSAALNAWIKV